MNRLPWFTHDHNAHEDFFIQEIMDRFGHFGYAAYFIILELLHKHGSGDILKITPARLCLELRSKRLRVRQLLDCCREAGKMYSIWKPDGIEIQIKKFRERQSKLKSNLPSTFRQPSVNLPLYREGEREGHKQPPISPKEDFEFEKHFWSLWPEKKGRAAAERAWKKVPKDAITIKKISDAIQNQEAARAAANAAGKFCAYRKNPGPWLNDKRWEDEVRELLDIESTKPTLQELVAEQKRFNELPDGLRK